MRFECLDLTRYGRFTEAKLAFPAPAAGGADLHVIFGPNEAGKSTLFSAWLDFLYGIPSRSRYDFKHAGPTMRIGAQISHAGGVLDLARQKRLGSSLLDAHGAVVPDTLLQSALGGLSREGYMAMFSLDDDTLEKGGDSILASRGDLGEMLFSASAGLAGLGPQLAAIRAELDSFHRAGGRKGVVYEAKTRLADLDRQRRALDTSAAAYQRLGRDVVVAERDWHTARDAEAAIAQTLRDLQAALAILPLRDRLARLEADHIPFEHLPDADDAAVQNHQALEAARSALASRIADRAERIEMLDARTAALTPDPAILGVRDAILSADALRSAHDSAVQDLPRRRDEAATVETKLRETLVRLGRPGAAVEPLLLDPARLSVLRGLLAERSGVFTAVARATGEVAKAKAKLEAAQNRLGDPGTPEDLAGLQALLTRFRTADPSGAVRMALRDRDERAAQMQAALQTLMPWHGDADALAALAVPASWQVEAWVGNEERYRQAVTDTERALQQAQSARDSAEVLAGQAADTIAGVTLADAAAARSQREAHWAAHRADLKSASADAFEAALRQDDQIAALLADTMARARLDAADASRRAGLAAAVSAAKDHWAQACSARDALAATLDATCAALGLAGAALADLRRWLDLRLAALGVRAALRQAEDTLARTEADLRAATAALQTMLGLGSDHAGFDALWASATARLDASDKHRDARRQLSELQADLQDRTKDHTAAEANAAAWLAAWQTACASTALAGLPADSAGLGDMLDLLDALGRDAALLAGLTDRIAKMEQNRAGFRDAVALILLAIQLSPETPWAELPARLRQAEDASAKLAELSRNLTDDRDAQVQDHRQAEANAGALNALGAALGWAEGGASLGSHVADCQRAAQLRRDMNGLRADLANRPPSAEGLDFDALTAQEAAMQGALELRHSETQAAFAVLLEAKRQLSAVGGDDAVARLEAERANLLNALRDGAQAHLARRFGLIAVEQGLRRYRDSHRSAMLDRASAAFHSLSRGAYTGLAAQPDGATEVLVALSAAGGAKLAADLSKGTRFQLYLALRIAGYHELAQSRPTVPFIADDIMETFDDDRAAAAFTLLAEMSRAGQVIYLTHHRHLCDIARAACAGVRVTDLQTL